jgi:hypothetical protein
MIRMTKWFLKRATVDWSAVGGLNLIAEKLLVRQGSDFK